MSLITLLPVVGVLLGTISDEVTPPAGYLVCDLAMSGDTLIMLRSADNSQVLFHKMIYKVVLKAIKNHLILN